MSDGVLIAIIGAGAACFGAWMSYLAARAAGHARDEAAAANRAVNHRPADEPTIYELAVACAIDAKAARTAAEHSQGIVTEVAGEQQRHLAWHQRDEQDRAQRQGVLDERLSDVLGQLEAGGRRFARIERALGIDPDDTDGDG